MQRLVQQCIKFIGLSGVGWVLDFITFAILKIFSSNLVCNNFISSFFGVTFVFAFSSKIIFTDNKRIPIDFKYLIYIIYQVFLVYCMSEVLTIVNKELVANVNCFLFKNYSYLLAKIAITPITMIINFFVMKCLMEKI